MHRLIWEEQELPKYISDEKVKKMGGYIWVSIFILLAVAAFYMRKSAIKLSKEQQKDSAHLIILTDDTFNKTIKNGITLVDFWAPWCTPCKIQNPVISQVADELKEKAKICKLNVDEHRKTANLMKIRNIPNIIIFKDGEAVKQLIGVKPKHTIMKAVTSLFN